MKKWIALVAMVAALGMASPVQASSLLPGATVSPVPPGTETSTTVVATFNEDFTTTTSLHGNIQETVFRETGGTLDFDYQVSSTPMPRIQQKDSAPAAIPDLLPTLSRLLRLPVLRPARFHPRVPIAPATVRLSGPSILRAGS